MYTGLNFKKLEKKIVADMNGFDRTIKLGKNPNIIINKHWLNTHGFQKNMKEALNTYKQYGKNMNKEDITWRGSQKEIGQYLDKPWNRKIIYVVGENGNDGRLFFQRSVLEEFGY